MQQLPELQENKAVRLVWCDSQSSPGWHYNREKLSQKAEVVSVGFVIKNTAEYITIASSIALEGGFIDPLSIPWGSVTKVIPYK